MKRVVTTTVSLLAVLLFAGTARAQDAKIEKGKKVFEAQKCVMCHSIEGKGNAKGPLDGAGAKLAPAQIKEWIVDPKTASERTKAARKPPMKAYPNLPADELDALIAYIQSLKKK
jgi:mono/diheme cytochrome c family protein